MYDDAARKTLTLVRDVWAAHPSGSELKVVLMMSVALTGMALCAAAPAEIEAILVGNPLGARSFCLFLLISTVIFGAVVGAVDTTTTHTTAAIEPLPRSSLAISVRLLLTRLAGEMLSWCARVAIILLRALTCIARSPVGHDLSELPTADFWPSGDSPRLIYES